MAAILLHSQVSVSTKHNTLGSHYPEWHVFATQAGEGVENHQLSVETDEKLTCRLQQEIKLDHFSKCQDCYISEQLIRRKKKKDSFSESSLCPFLRIQRYRQFLTCLIP